MHYSILTFVHLTNYLKGKTTNERYARRSSTASQDSDREDDSANDFKSRTSSIVRPSKRGARSRHASMGGALDEDPLIRIRAKLNKKQKRMTIG